MRKWGAVALILGFALTACSSGGTVPGVVKPSGSKASGTGPGPTSHSIASGQQGSSAASSPKPDTTVTKAEAATALTAYQKANNAANAALDTAAIAKIESGALLAVDQATLVYNLGVGGDRAKQTKLPLALNNPVFYLAHSTTYPRGFFVTTDAVQSGAPNYSFLMHFAQNHPGAPWLVDSIVDLSPGQQWPAFAVGPDGLLDYGAIQQSKLALSTADLAAADRTMIADDNPGQPGSPFLSDDPTTKELRWIQGMNEDVSPASTALTVTTDLNPAPLTLPLKNGGELALYSTRFSLRISQSGRTFTFGDQGWAKIAGTDSFADGYTADAVFLVAAIDPPDKAAKVQKVAENGGLVSVH